LIEARDFFIPTSSRPFLALSHPSYPTREPIISAITKKMTISGSDIEPEILKIAQQNIGAIELSERDLTTAEKQTPVDLLIANPPYGERLALPFTHKDFVEKLQAQYSPQTMTWMAPGDWTKTGAKLVAETTNGGIEVGLWKLTKD
jgi:trans-aconitate methyltransferase